MQLPTSSVVTICPELGGEESVEIARWHSPVPRHLGDLAFEAVVVSLIAYNFETPRVGIAPDSEKTGLGSIDSSTEEVSLELPCDKLACCLHAERGGVEGQWPAKSRPDIGSIGSNDLVLTHGFGPDRNDLQPVSLRSIEKLSNMGATFKV